MKKYEVPLQELQISYGNINVVSGESSRYRIEEDRFMLYTIYQLGLDKPNVYDHLKDAIMYVSGLIFCFRYYLLSAFVYTYNYY